MEHWTVRMHEGAIVIVCRGHDINGSVTHAVRTFDEMAKKLERFDIIADLTDMTGYETSSRQAWSEVFRHHRLEIRGLIVVGAKRPLIKMGATMVGMFSRITTVFVDDWSEIPVHLRPREPLP